MPGPIVCSSHTKVARNHQQQKKLGLKEAGTQKSLMVQLLDGAAACHLFERKKFQEL